MPASSERLDGRDKLGIQTHAGQPEIQRDRDFRGSYGYGRPAHRTDPNAQYGFETNWLSSKRSG